MGGENSWRRIKLALGLNTHVNLSVTTDNDESDVPHRKSITPTSSSSGLLPICAICLTSLKVPNSQAIFTAECSHSFHFHCIASNVKHGNRICPICRAKWKVIPSEKTGSSTNSNPWSHQNQQSHTNHDVLSLFQAPEIPLFDDDEELFNHDDSDLSDFNGEIEMKTYPEVYAVARSTSFDNFGILINLKAPVTKRNLNACAPIDLVTILDVSGSMVGSKIALLKQAMCFVVQSLGPSDRLSVIAFSSSARRLFPLRRMTETMKQQSLLMINSLFAEGWTNMADALKKGAKVMTDRKFKNPVSGMILLSDGQDSSISPGPLNPIEAHIPIHTFGFGMDHDACAMHNISEQSGGMFSFIEDESVIQDAFAQCIGGLLSVVVQDLRVEVECVHPVLRLGFIKTGSYKTGTDEVHRSGFIEVGDLYAEEERDFLVGMDIPVADSAHEMSLVKFRVSYRDPIRKAVITVGGNEVIILRPESTPVEQMVSLEVDRQRNRLKVATAIAEAQTMAERGDLNAAISVLEDCRNRLMDSVSGRGGDQLCAGLVVELGNIMDRMVSHGVYESLGRAYVLSGLSSHSWQRATTRGDSTKTTSEILRYQTQSMVNMVNLSQTMYLNQDRPNRPNCSSKGLMPSKE